MKIRRTLAPLILSLLVCQAYSFEPTSIYRAADIEATGGGMMWRDSAGSNNLQLADPAEFTIGDRPEVGDDEKSAVFSGRQTTGFRTTKALPVPATALQVSLAFKPENVDNEVEQTILRQGNWELRYTPKTKRLLFIVWHDSKEYTMVASPVQTGVWQEVKASYENGMMNLEVDGVPKSVEAKGPLGSHHAASALFVGAYPGEDFRAVCGAMADIRIAAE
jgi:hypothetical protein